MKEIQTKNFIIIFPEKYKKEAQKTANYLEDIHKKLTTFLNWIPYEKTTVVLTDNNCIPNGMGIPFLRNTILIYLAPPLLEKTLKDYQDPLYSLLLHEYTHVLHLDQIRGAAWLWRALYGKIYSPVSGSFRWYIEGMAVFTESIYANGGRLSTPYTKSMIKTHSANNKIPNFDTLIYPVNNWPYGIGLYHFGGRFLEYLYNTYGKEKFDQIYLKISDDFWFFVFFFVMNFKNIYGKSLQELWNEWINYEKIESEKSEKIELQSEKLTNLGTGINSINKIENDFYISTKGALYYLKNNKKLKKIIKGNILSVTDSNDKNIILYTKLVSYPGSYLYYDIFSYNLKTKIEKKLSHKLRSHYLCYENGNLIIVSHNGSGASLYLSKFTNNKITDINKIYLPENIYFIGQPSLKNNNLLFSAKFTTGELKIINYNLNNLTIELPDENISGYNPKWIDNYNFSFISKDNDKDSVYLYNIKTKSIKKILSTNETILNSIVDNEYIYYINYTINGEELFVTKNNINDYKSIEKLENQYDLSGDYLKNIRNNIFRISNYNPLRYLPPPLWGIYLFQLDSTINLKIGDSYLSLPYIGPQLMISNSLPLGRFYYLLSIGYDYIKNYPVNSLTLSFKLPYLNISYNWNNYTGGKKDYYLLSNKSYFKETKYNNKFPVYFNNGLDFYYSFSLPAYGILSWIITITHYYKEYDIIDNKTTNKISISQKIIYYYILSEIPSGPIRESRWNYGIYFNLSALEYINKLLDNNPKYLLRFLFMVRYPLSKLYIFTRYEAGIDFMFNNSFTAETENIRLSESFSGMSKYDSFTKIDFKAFSPSLSKISSGSIFSYTNFGVDISVIAKTKYIHFGTIVFKEFYIIIFNEFLYLYNNKKYYPDILFDFVCELGLDLFVDYGNIGFSFILGASIGYRIYDYLPAWNIFFYLSMGL